MQSFVVASVLVVLFLVQTAFAPPPPPEGYAEQDYNDNNSLDHLLGLKDKRACIRRGVNCDARPNDCCEGSACRCNLWGSNCRCERAGLLQQWGRK